MSTRRILSRKTIITGLALMAILLSACSNLFSPSPNAPALDTGAIHTQAVQTVSAQQTLAVGQNAVAQLTQQAAEEIPASPTAQSAQPTDTPQPTATTAPPTPTDTQVPPSPTTEPTQTSAPPTQAPVPATRTPIPQPCDGAQFVSDVTVKDGTTFAAGKEFTKTWRVKNIGTCNWTVNYNLVFVRGDRIGAAKFNALEDRVRPGETVDISIDMVAPDEPGTYSGEWMLQNADGELFGLGDRQDKPFWVSIKVIRQNKLVWDLTEDYCLGRWSTGALDGLACPDLSEDKQIGFVNLHPRPKLENGGTENEPALVTFPNQGEKGFIQGVFPAYTVKNGDHFRAAIGCLDGAKKCDVTFRLSWRNKSGRVETLGTWNEKYNGKIRKIDIDLSELAGKRAELILTVQNRGDSADDQAFWLLPSIWN